MKNLNELVREKKIDIRKVDKGQMIMVIDYDQRIKAETLRIEEIASPTEDQQPNWKENKEFVEVKMRELYRVGFISNRELTAVTGLLPGGVCGTLINNDGSMKFTRIKENNELVELFSNFTNYQWKPYYNYNRMKWLKESLLDLWLACQIANYQECKAG